MIFDGYELKDYVVRALNDLKFKSFTDVQKAVFDRMKVSRNILAKSKTGSGKTHSFLVPIFQSLVEDDYSVQAVIVAPTKELALQIYKVAQHIASFCKDRIDIRLFSGGTDRNKEIERLNNSQPQIVIGTPGKVKDLAVDETYQSENLASLLVNEILNYFRSNNIYNYQVFTKPKYKNIFISLGFKKIVETDKVIMLEGGVTFINDKLKEINKILNNKFGEINQNTDLGCVVINGNPITNGHMHIIEEASRNHKLVVLFVVEEDKSEFTFEERFSFAYLSTMRLGNVCVIPSSKYIVSSSTFPSYFLKDETEVSEQYSKIDALIFKEYFMKQLFIKKRYVGTETISKMVNYNNILKETLQDKLVIMERLQENNEVISASKVRSLLKENKIEEALLYVPREISFILRSVASSKYGN